ncbi:hypothetical protein BC830DRAFT_1062209 [Chytriomyces sp. MP71]|nr:hypothetical protein BC830DRAFT_1062209 [Chytriomyces sp. MP71]
MSLFYKSDCPFFVCGQPLVPPIDFRQELMAVAVAFALTINCRFLDYFIKLNAVALLDRDNFLKELFNMNVELLKQLRKEKETEIVDLESPLTKVLQILGEIRDSDAADSFMIKELDRIMKVLHSDQLYTPDIFQKSSDADVSEWLKMMMQQTPNAGGAGAGSGSISTVVRSGFEYEFIGGDGDARGSHVVTFSLTPDQQMSTQESRVFELLRDIDDPSFDVSVVESVSNGRVLFYVGYYLFLKYDMLRKHKIPESVFRNWLTRVEHGYRGTNPYHNAIHAADVAHSMNYYINKARIWTHISPEEQLASFIAAIIHDFMHPGVNNTFLINTNNPLALRYNDVAVLENFHCATIFEIMESNEDLNILRSLSIEAQKVVRETVVSAVLATDIAMHFDWIGKFKNKMGPTSGGINWDVKLDRRLVINMAIKCADVNNPTKPLEACKYWTEKIMEEFFRQGDEEKKRGVQVSMFMNRASTDIPKCQIGFIDFIVFPLFEVWSVFMQEDVQPQMQNIATNKQYWKDQGAIQ